MDLKRKNVKIILSGLILIIVVTALFIALKRDDKQSDGPVSYKVAEKLYEDNVSDNCTEVIKIDQNMDVSKVEDKVLLSLIFGQMKKEEILNSKISVEDYKNAALKLMEEKNIPLKFEFIYEGYKYSLDGDVITRNKAKCSERYVSKLYGYSGTDNLELDIMAGYVENGKVYDLNDNEIGTYNENELNNILDKGTMQVYNYEKVNNNYKLVSVGVK